jgi:hypothetical protein
MSNEIGIDLRVDAQTDGLRQAGQDFDQFSSKLSSVLGINDPEKAEQFWEEYNSGLEKAVSMTDKMSLIAKRDGTGGGKKPGDKDDEKEKEKDKALSFPGKEIFRLEKSLKGAVSGFSRDAGGAVVNSSEDILSGLAKLWGKMPTAAKIATGAALGTVAVAAVGDSLSKQYESVIPAVMSATAALGKFGETASQQSTLFRTTMAGISETAAQYGYTFSQGAAVVEKLARTGAKDAMGGASSVMSYAKGYGFQTIPEEFAALYGLFSRYGGRGEDAYGGRGEDALSYVAGGARRTVGDARIQDYMAATSSILEEGLSEGIVKGVKEISATQNFLFSMFGELAGGREGAQLYSKLSSGVRGSTGLQSETDLLMYRAARDIGNPGENYITTMMRLEKGFTPEIFKQFKDNISGATYSEQIELIRQAFGVNYTQASDMYHAKTDSELSAAVTGAAPGGAIKDTAESRLIGAQERIANEIRMIGAGVLDIKVQIISATASIVQALVGDQVEALNKAQRDKDLLEIYNSAPESMRRANSTIASRIAGWYKLDPYEPYMKDLSDMLTGPAAKGFWGKVSPEQASSLSAIDDADPSTPWTGTELKLLYDALIELRASIDGNTEATVDAGSGTTTVTVPSSTPSSVRDRRLGK